MYERAQLLAHNTGAHNAFVYPEFRRPAFVFTRESGHRVACRICQGANRKSLERKEGMMADDIEAYNQSRKAAQRKTLAMLGIGLCAIVLVVGFFVKKFLGDTASLAEMSEAVEKQELQAAEFEALPPLEKRNLKVSSTPGNAAIVVNGIATGLETPTTVEVVQDETNTIMLIKDGYVTTVQNVTPDTPELDVTLQEYAVKSEADARPPLDINGEETDGPIRGRIDVVSRDPSGTFDGAEVLWNGRPQPQVTPMSLMVQPNQLQHVTVRHAAHEDGVIIVQARPYRKTVDAREALVELQKTREGVNTFSAIAIRTFPRNAQVWMDDEEITGDLITSVARNRHFTIRAESPGLEPFEQSFDATVGTIDLSIMLQRTIFPDGGIEVSGAPDDATIYLVPQREDAESGQQIGRNGSAPLRIVESGPYTLRVAGGPYNQRTKDDFDIDIPANERLVIRLERKGGALQIVEQKKDRLPK